MGEFPNDNPLDLTLIVIISSSLAGLTLSLLIAGIYFVCIVISSGDSESVTGFASSYQNFSHISSKQSSAEYVAEQEEIFLPQMKEIDRSDYLRGKEFQRLNPPDMSKMGKAMSLLQQQQIDDRGLDAFQFEYAANEPFSPDYLVEDKTEITFVSDAPSCAVLNLPLPIKNRERDTLYYEVKVFETPGAPEKPGIFSIGLVTKPYPQFRLPGYNNHSVAYENSGFFRLDSPFDASDILPKLVEGDVVGIGFRPSTGTVFFTRNGKKLYDVIHGMKLNLYPAIGARFCSNYKFQVNLGQIGFVYIEANVKKWGLAKNFGTLGAPPAYGKDKEDDYTVIAEGEPIPPNYVQEDFFGTIFKKSSPRSLEKVDERTPLLGSNSPPSYKSYSSVESRDDGRGTSAQLM